MTYSRTSSNETGQIMNIFLNTIFKYKVFVFLLFVISIVHAAPVPKDLAYPDKNLDAYEIARQVFFVNNYYAFANTSLQHHPRGVAQVINRDPGKKTTRLTIERHINNTYRNKDIRSRELAIFRSGKLKGTAVLITEYNDETKTPTYTFWIPTLRRIRRIEVSDIDASWGGTIFTVGEMKLRKPDDEIHELQGIAPFDVCPENGQLVVDESSALMNQSSRQQCKHKGKKVYLLKSRHKSASKWYDYRVSYIDTETFADYRTEYYKDGRKIKLIDKDWRTTSINDKRALQWHHIYGKNFNTGRETYIDVPGIALAVNNKMQADFWSEETLRKLNIENK